MKSTSRWMAGVTLVASLALAGSLVSAGRTTAGESVVDDLTFTNASGVLRTITTAGTIDFGNPFFQELGTNGRTCFSCHRPAQGWTVTPSELRRRFDATGGLDPIFRNNDGSTCDGADLSTLRKRRQAFSLLLTKGLIRVGLDVPSNAEFDIIDVDDPYGCGAPLTSASLYRRPLPSTNLRFLSTVMWDGRETVSGQAIRNDLMGQAMHATTGHAEGAPPSPAVLAEIVDFELGLVTAQTRDFGVGSLRARDASGGPRALAGQPFCIGINDPLKMLPPMPGACATPSRGLDPIVFTLFQPWASSRSSERQAIARGEAIFNIRHFVIDDVPGLNGRPGDPVSGPIAFGTCTLCHDTPNAGNHSVSLPLDIGLTDITRRTPDLPLYTLRNRTTGDTVQTTDPGRAMVTGRWNDIGKFKGPVLRALAARAPYFHNGSAATLADVVEFYDGRFKLHLTRREKADLVAFLGAL